MNLKQALEEFRETRRLSQINPIDGDPRTYPGRDMMRKQAAVELPSKVKQLTETLKPVSFVVFVEGPGFQKTVELASEQAEVLSVDTQGVLRHVVDAIEASLPRNRQFELNSFFVLEDQLLSFQRELGLIPERMYFQDVKVVATRADTEALVESYVRKYLGENFLVATITQKVVEAAVNLVGDAPVVPVFVSGISKEFADSVGPKTLGGKFISFFAGDEVDQKEVMKLFTNIKKTIKNQKDN